MLIFFLYFIKFFSFIYFRIPDPDVNVGSNEVRAVASALQHRIVSDLINSAIIRPLSKYSIKEHKKDSNDRESEQSMLLFPPITTSDLLSTLVAVATGR